MKDQLFKLTLVTHRLNQSSRDYFNFIAICARSGITAVQLREKELTGNELLQFGQSLKELLDSLQVPLIVNDNVDLCLRLDARGVHLGQDDGDVVSARKMLGANKIIGLTVNTLSQLEVANHLPIDYIGVGAVFPTHNKSQVQTIWGIDSLRQAVSLSRHPIIAIGGINESNAEKVMATGVLGIAAIGAFHDAIDPRIATQTLKYIIDREQVS